MNIGSMRHTVTLQRPVESLDSVGDNVTTWTDVGTFRAAVRPASGREQEIASQVNAQVSHVVTMRYLKQHTIDATMRFLYRGSRYLNIVSVLNADEGNHSLTVYVIENTPADTAATTPEGSVYNGGTFNG